MTEEDQQQTKTPVKKAIFHSLTQRDDAQQNQSAQAGSIAPGDQQPPTQGLGVYSI